MIIHADRKYMNKNRLNGFSLLELLITLSIAGTLLGLGIPSFSAAMADSRIGGQYNSLVGSLYRARSEAVKGAMDVTVCPKNAVDGLQCGGVGDWTNGWIVFTDRQNVPNETTAVIENQSDILAMEPEIKGLNTLSSFGSTTNVVANAAAVNYVRYLQNGSSSLTTGFVVICDVGRGAAESRVLNIVQTGDIRAGTATSGSNAPRDVFNRPISAFCADPI